MSNSDTQPSEHSTPAEFSRLLEWWRELDNNRGDRAALRRASGIDEVVFNPAFHRLWHSLRETRWKKPDRVALVAALASRVKEHEADKSFAAQLGSPQHGADKPPLSGLRFRRLLQATDESELLQSCARAIAMRRGQVNLTSLAESVYWWNDRTRKQWAFDYYDACPSAD